LRAFTHARAGRVCPESEASRRTSSSAAASARRAGDACMDAGASTGRTSDVRLPTRDTNLSARRRDFRTRAAAELEDRSTHADRMAFLVRLADGLAHEIKNPLSTMSINLALMQEDWERAGVSRSQSQPLRTPREERSLKRIKTLQREVS